MGVTDGSGNYAFLITNLGTTVLDYTFDPFFIGSFTSLCIEAIDATTGKLIPCLTVGVNATISIAVNEVQYVVTQ